MMIDWSLSSFLSEADTIELELLSLLNSLVRVVYAGDKMALLVVCYGERKSAITGKYVLEAVWS